jgi:hypothetical protein
MSTVILEINEQSLAHLAALATAYHTTVEAIIAAFAHDLAAAQAPTPQRWRLPSGGSDEREYAEEWFQRNVGHHGGVAMNEPIFVRQQHLATAKN